MCLDVYELAPFVVTVVLILSICLSGCDGVGAV
jgi:hypothetical protein